MPSLRWPRSEYYSLSEKLRILGFKEDTSDGAPLCRWLADSVILDVMPTDAGIPGFGNQWFASAMEHSRNIELSDGMKIRIVSAPYFLMTKLEAFEGRGNGDYLMSRDIEDIVAVLDGRPEIRNELRQADPVLAQAIAERCSALLKEARFIDALPGHMPAGESSSGRVSMLLDTVRAISEIS